MKMEKQKDSKVLSVRTGPVSRLLALKGKSAIQKHSMENLRTEEHFYSNLKTSLQDLSVFDERTYAVKNLKERSLKIANDD